MKEQIVSKLKELYHFKDVMEWRLERKRKGFLPGVTLEETKKELEYTKRDIKKEEDHLFEIMKGERMI
ncbi:hypothetical protein EYB35_07290 [Bacillus paranthracis]|nr:hypothetical protein EYB35_07290 [Bacillus paranthracis]